MTYVRRLAFTAAALWAVLPGLAAGQGVSAAPASWVEQVMSVRSVVGEGPQWMPGGSAITFMSGLGGGGLWSISPEGGFPTRLTSELGGAGHFLQAQEPTWSPTGQW